MTTETLDDEQFRSFNQELQELNGQIAAQEEAIKALIGRKKN